MRCRVGALRERETEGGMVRCMPSPRARGGRETTARPAMAARQPSRRAAATAAAEAAAVAEMAAAAEGGDSGGGGGGEAKRLWSKHRASLALVTRVKPSQAAPIEALTTPRLAKLREQRTVHDLFAGIDNNPDHSMEEEHSKTQSSALPAEFSLPEERGLAQLELSPGFAPLRRVARRGKSSAQAVAASLEVLASEQRKSSKRLQRVVRSTSRSLLDEGISMGEIYASKQACCWPLHLPTFFARPHVCCIRHNLSSTSRAAAPRCSTSGGSGRAGSPGARKAIALGDRVTATRPRGSSRPRAGP